MIYLRRTIQFASSLPYWARLNFESPETGMWSLIDLWVNGLALLSEAIVKQKSDCSDPACRL